MPTAQDYKDQKLELLVKKALSVRYTRYDFVPGQENNVLSSFFSEIFCSNIIMKFIKCQQWIIYMTKN